MKIRTRLTLWYAALMFATLIAIGAFSYHEFIIEPHEHSRNAHLQRDEVAEEQDDFLRIAGILVSCGICTLALAIGGGWWLMRKAMAPVVRLTGAAARVNENNLREQLPRSGNGDELDRLTEVFNSMLQRLDQSFTRIHEFTLHASHELKTPLTILRGQAETALREDTLTPAQQEFHAGQLEELARLTQIVDGLTLLAKADAGLLKLNLAPVPLDELVHENFADAKILAQESSIQVAMTHCEPMMVSGDQHRLRQLLLNLADNAIKHNQAGGNVTMSLRRGADTAEFMIANTGRGIPDESLPRVFDRFYRVDPAHGKEVEGTGLGLSIAQWIVKAHRGEIYIVSMLEGLTTVTVKLPLVGHPA